MGAGDGASQPLYLAGAEVRSGGPFIFFFSSPAPLSPPPPRFFFSAAAAPQFGNIFKSMSLEWTNTRY